jgi:hypothetical protein
MEHSPPDRWCRVQIIATVLSVVAIPIVVALMGNRIAMSMKNRDVEVRLVELAIGILQTPSEQREDLHGWARRVVDRYSGVSLSTRAAEQFGTIRIDVESIRVVSYQAKTGRWIPLPDSVPLAPGLQREWKVPR